jgi:ParB family transcriptional regulator, chromosome partitioning protein
MARKGGLGRGLDALIPGDDNQPQAGAVQIPVGSIRPNPRQPRREMAQTELEELAASIREHGIIQPLIVTREGISELYTLIAGERRLRAATMVGLASVPAIVRDASELQRLELALIENIQREDLSPIEAAEAYQDLAEEFGLSHDDIATQVGKSRVAVTNTIRLLKLPEPVLQALQEGRITEGHARALLMLPTAQAQSAALQTILRHNLTVRQVEELTRKMVGEKPQPAPKPIKPNAVRDLEERMRGKLGTKVSIQHGKHGGTIVIHYYSAEELESLVEQLLNA